MDEIVSIRTATAADAEAIGKLTREAYAKWVQVIGRGPLPMTIDYAEAIKRHRFDLLHIDGELAGLVETRPQGERLMIENIAVRPAFQGRGVGTRLLQLAEALATEAGLIGTRLYTNQRFSENLSLYAARGYRVEREEKLNGGVAVHMTKG
jgi:ribosomal protein S18 acetylase RimI-like enzyme